MGKNSLHQELLSWIGTPYQRGKCEKGVGADCVSFVFSIQKFLGKIRNDYALPKYPTNSESKEMLSFLQGEIKKALGVFNIVSDIDDLQTGDISIHASRGRYLHLSFVYEADLYHCRHGYGVMPSEIKSSPFDKTFVKGYR